MTAQPDLPPRVRAYIAAVAQACTAPHATSATSPATSGLVSLVLFGSAARGGFHRQVSDVDLIVVLPDSASREERARVRDMVGRLETGHGFREPANPASPRNPFRAFAERVCGHDLSRFVCTRSDLLSGDVARVFGLNAAEALFVDRIVLANVIASAVTVWGEDLLPSVSTGAVRLQPPPVRRLDIVKAWFALTDQVLLTLLAYALLPDATR